MWGIQFCDAAELEPKLQNVSLGSSPSKKSLQKSESQESKEYLLVDYPNFENRGSFNLRFFNSSFLLFQLKLNIF